MPTVDELLTRLMPGERVAPPPPAPGETLVIDWAPVRAARDRVAARFPGGFADATVVILSDADGNPPAGLSYHVSAHHAGKRRYGRGDTPDAAVADLLREVEEVDAVTIHRATRLAAERHVPVTG